MIEFVLNGNIVTSPLEWSNVGFKASFEQTVQADISVNELTFGFEAISLIDNWLSSNGYFRGMPLEIRENGVLIFDGFLDFNEKFEEVHTGKYLVSVKKNKGLNELSDKIDSYTFGLLDNNTPLTYYDVPFIIDKVDYSLENALLSLTNILILKEIYEGTRRIAMAVKELTMAISNPVTSPERIIGVSIQLLIDIAYVSLMIVTYKNYITSFINELLGIVKYHKSNNAHNVLTNLFNDLGFNGFDTGITELKDIYYLPSRNEEKTNGIPKVSDYGYTMSEYIELIESCFNAKLYVDNTNKVQLRSENDPYLIRNSTYVMPDILLESREYNTKDLVGTRNISFQTDVKDEWTVEEFKGTALDVYTKSTNTTGVDLVKGLERININACLGSRKNDLNGFEKALRSLAGLVDKLIKGLGGRSNLSSKITRKIGMLKVSNENWNKPKLLRLDSSLKLANNRSNWSARYLWDNYHSYKSFVLNGNGYQRLVYEGVEIPFSLDGFQKVINNSYFTTNSLKIGKFTNLEYNVDENKAVADFWIEEVYDKNLIEQYVEP